MKFINYNNILMIFISLLIFSSYVSTTNFERSTKMNRNNSKSKFLTSRLTSTVNKFVSRKAGKLTIEDLLVAADREVGFEKSLRTDLKNSEVSNDLRITRIRLLENKKEYGLPMIVKGTEKRYTHQSIAICLKTYSKSKHETQDGIDNKKTAYFFLFERMAQDGMPDIRFQYLGHDVDCRDGVTATAKNWNISEMFTLNADFAAAIKVDERMSLEAQQKAHDVLKALKEFFIKKAKEQAAWLVGHAALTTVHLTGVGIVVSGPLHLIYGAAHAIHTAASTVDDIIDTLKISKDIALYLKNILSNPIQKKLENDKVKDKPANNRSMQRFIDALNAYEIDIANSWQLDVSDSRTFATGFYNSIKKGHENNDYVKFKYFTKSGEDESLHAKRYFDAAPTPSTSGPDYTDIDY